MASSGGLHEREDTRFDRLGEAIPHGHDASEIWGKLRAGNGPGRVRHHYGHLVRLIVT
jgi:hypothetical protein